MQIWKFSYMLVIIWKQYPANFARYLCMMFVSFLKSGVSVPLRSNLRKNFFLIFDLKVD